MSVPFNKGVLRLTNGSPTVRHVWVVQYDPGTKTGPFTANEVLNWGVDGVGTFVSDDSATSTLKFYRTSGAEPAATDTVAGVTSGNSAVIDQLHPDSPPKFDENIAAGQIVSVILSAGIHKVGATINRDNFDLTENYLGSSVSDADYNVVQFYAPNYSIPLPTFADVNAPAIIERAHLEIDSTIRRNTELEQNLLSSGGVLTIDWLLGYAARVVLFENVATINLTAPQYAGALLRLRVQNDSGGALTVTWPGSVDWGDQGAPDLSGADAVTVILFYWDGAAYRGLYSVGGSSQPPVGGSVVWTEGTLGPNWSNSDPTYYNPAYTKDPRGLTFLRGAGNNQVDSEPSTIFRIPESLRPLGTVRLLCRDSPVSGEAEIEIDVEGRVTHNGQFLPHTDGTRVAELAACRFSAASSLQVQLILGDTGPVFGTNWQAVGAPYVSPRLWMDAESHVFLEGAARNPVDTAATIVTLPAGYRPPRRREFICQAGNLGDRSYNTVSVETSGVVSVQDTSEISTGVWLGAICFLEAGSSITPTVVGGGGGAPPFASGWASFNVGTYGNVRFWKDAQGFVHIESVATPSGSPPDLIFTLPAGFRPAKEVNFLTRVGAAGSMGLISVAANGDVRRRAGSAGDGTSVFLDGAMFFAEA